MRRAGDEGPILGWLVQSSSGFCLRVLLRLPTVFLFAFMRGAQCDGTMFNAVFSVLGFIVCGSVFHGCGFCLASGMFWVLVLILGLSGEFPASAISGFRLSRGLVVRKLSSEQLTHGELMQFDALILHVAKGKGSVREFLLTLLLSGNWNALDAGACILDRCRTMRQWRSLQGHGGEVSSSFSCCVKKEKRSWRCSLFMFGLTCGLSVLAIVSNGCVPGI